MKTKHKLGTNVYYIDALKRIKYGTIDWAKLTQYCNEPIYCMVNGDCIIECDIFKSIKEAELELKRRMGK